MIRQLAKAELTSRVWASATSPGLIRLRIGTQDYSMPRLAAIGLAQAIVEAVDHAKAAEADAADVEAEQ
jgi:hypothetical protein